MNAQPDKEKLVAFMEAASSALTGRQIVIRLRRPVIASFLGQVFKNTKGEILVDVSPDLDLQQTYTVWLHEISHIFCGHIDHASPRNFDEFPLSEIPKEIADSLQAGVLFLEMSEENRQDYENDPQEQEAGMTASGLDDYASSQAYYRFGKDDLISKLMILSQMQIVHRGESND